MYLLTAGTIAEVTSGILLISVFSSFIFCCEEGEKEDKINQEDEVEVQIFKNPSA